MAASDSTPPAKRPTGTPASGAVPRKPAAPPNAPAKKAPPSARQLDQLADLVDELLERNDYPEVIRIIEEIPAPHRTIELNKLLKEANQLKAQVEKLERELEKHLNLRDMKALEKTVDQLLDLRPAHPRGLEIDDALSRYGSKGILKVLHGNTEFDAVGSNWETWQIVTAVTIMIVLLVAVGVGSALYMRSKNKELMAASSVLDSVGKKDADDPPEGDAAQAKPGPGAYQELLGKQSLERAYQTVEKAFGKNRMAIVVINNVVGVEADVDHYVERKLFKAAYPDYAAGEERARQATESNKQAAAQQAMSQQPQHFRGFGPRTVWFRYQQVQSDVPYPVVLGGNFKEGQYAYYVGPVLDVNQFSSRINLGAVTKTDAGNRTITIESAIPSPVPDIDVEELYIQFGKEEVAVIDLLGALGEPDRVNYYLETEFNKLAGNKSKLTMIGPRLISKENYRVYLAPVRDLDQFLTGISFGNITELNIEQRTAQIAANLPADLPRRPTAAELAELERKAREAARKPREGETEVDFVIRILNDSSSDDEMVKLALQQAARLDVDAARQNDMVDALIAQLEDKRTWIDQKLVLAALERWHNDRVIRKIKERMEDANFGSERETLLKSLGRMPHPESARVVAMLMTDRWLAKTASRALRDIGPPAEDTALLLAQDAYVSMRAEAYDILSEIGTEKGLAKMKTLLPKEKDKQAKGLLKSAIDRLQTRLERIASEPSSPVKPPAVASTPDPMPESTPSNDPPAVKPKEKVRKPAGEETQIDVAIRMLEDPSISPGDLESACKTLAEQEVDPARIDDVAKALIRGLDGTWVWHRRDHYLRAMEAWICPKIIKEFGRMLADNNSKIDKEDILKVLGRHPSEETANTVAVLMTDNRLAKSASQALRDMGAVAEPVVMKLARDKFPSMRAEAYDILLEIGTAKTLEKMRGMLSGEKDKEARAALKTSIARLEARLAEDKSGAN